MSQGGLFRPTIVRTEPPPEDTATCKLVGIDQDGKLYYLKTGDPRPTVPAAEFICTRMAQDVGLRTPEPYVVYLGMDGATAFGSLQLTGLIDSREALLTILLTPAHHFERWPQVSLPYKVNAWIAFDLFINNCDHHTHNFMFQALPIAALIDVYGFDFDMALIGNEWPLPPPPLPPGCGTNRFRSLALKGQNTQFVDSAIAVTRRLLELPDSWMADIIATIPNDWLDDRLRRELCRWWRGARRKRIKLIRNHLGNGRYLQLRARSRHP